MSQSRPHPNSARNIPARILGDGGEDARVDNDGLKPNSVSMIKCLLVAFYSSAIRSAQPGTIARGPSAAAACCFRSSSSDRKRANACSGYSMLECVWGEGQHRCNVEVGPAVQSLSLCWIFGRRLRFAQTTAKVQTER